MDRERWQDFNLSWQHHLDTGAKISDRWNKSADALSQMMINTAFVINAGGIVGIPALHQFLNGDGTALPWEKTAAMLFFFGVIAAALSGIAAIWNFRMLADQTDHSYSITADEIREKWDATGEFVPSEELRLAKAAPPKNMRMIQRTFYVGWGFGILSYVMFLAGGLTIGGSSGVGVPNASATMITTVADPPKNILDLKSTPP
ncbi:MAG: hypothetical protein JSR99_09890 [Proteobacteria bacterium]|nr:hypothetical protein [Pseudomonadota bacterium]